MRQLSAFAPSRAPTRESLSVPGFALGAAALVGLSAPAEAAQLRLTARMQRYSGPAAYLAVYVTDARGRHRATLQVFGDKVQYYPHLSRWMRGAGPVNAPLDGVTGASVGSGHGLDVSVEIEDALIDAGLQLRVDASAQNIADEPAEIVLPLERAASGRVAEGRSLIARFSFELRGAP